MKQEKNFNWSIPGLISKNETLWTKKDQNTHMGSFYFYQSQICWTVSLSIVCTFTANMSLAGSQHLIMGSRECTKKKKRSSLVLTHLDIHTHTQVCASYTLQRPQQCTHPLYLAQGDSGRGTETKRRVISAMQTVPQVKSDRHQWNTATGFRPRSG